MIQNCISFWETARPDWYALYAEHTQRERAGEVGPRPWATRVLRRWDAARAALHAARREKMRRREEAVLQRGRGGAGGGGGGGGRRAGGGGGCGVGGGGAGDD